MQISVKFFASLREQMGTDEEMVESTAPLSIAGVWQLVTDRAPPENLLCSRNLKYVDWDESVEDGDEVAFFPPVTGG
ncbi:MAG: MoaD/ThiS family protein [Arenicellales bacterium]